MVSKSLESPLSRIVITYTLFLIQLITLFLFIPKVYGMLPKDAYAIYGIAISSFIIIQIVTLGYTQSFIRLILSIRAERSNIKLDSVYATIFAFSMIPALFIGFLIFGFIVVDASDFKVEISLFLVYFMLITFAEFGHSIVLGFDRFSASRLLRLSEIVSLLIGLYFITSSESFSLYNIASVYIISASIHLLILIYFLGRLGIGFFKFKPNVNIIKNEWKSSRWFLFGGGIGFALFAGDSYILSSVFGLTVFATYQPMMKLADIMRTVITQIPATIFTTVTDKYYRKEYRGLLDSFKFYYVIAVIVSITMVISSYIFGRFVLEYWLEVKINNDQFDFFIACVLFSSLHILDSIPSTFSGAMGLHTSTNKIAIVQVICKFSLFTFFLNYWGPLSLPISGIIAYCLTNSYYTPLKIVKHLKSQIALND